MFDWMMRSDGSRAIYLMRMVVLTLAGAVFVVSLLNGVFPNAPNPDLPTDPAAMLFGVVVFAPIVETLIMWAMISGFDRVLKEDRQVIFATALIWAALHSLSAWIWGPVVFWPWLLFCVTFMTWRKRSEIEGILMAIALHMLHNSVPTLLAISAGPAATG
jgi:membrane protease YdiL (CAAX protease family)